MPLPHSCPCWLPRVLHLQFSTGYGMVLNLLATRTLAEARSFLDRSFARYMGSIGAARRLRCALVARSSLAQWRFIQQRWWRERRRVCLNAAAADFGLFASLSPCLSSFREIEALEAKARGILATLSAAGVEGEAELLWAK